MVENDYRLISVFEITPNSVEYMGETGGGIGCFTNPLNFEVEKQKKEIAAQKKTNESLTMAIDELASLTKIQEVAQQQGLSYNNNNIKTVVEDS